MFQNDQSWKPKESLFKSFKFIIKSGSKQVSDAPKTGHDTLSYAWLLKSFAGGLGFSQQFLL